MSHVIVEQYVRIPFVPFIIPPALALPDHNAMQDF